MPSPQEPDDIRLRKHLNEPVPPFQLPAGYQLKPFAADDALALHALLDGAFDDQDQDFDRWWNGVSGDGEFDPALVFLVVDEQGHLAAAAQCWTSGFVKDLATAETARGQGLGEALMLAVFAAFKARGLANVDLKTSTILNAAAVRLYKRLGMVEVDWAG